MGQRLATLSSGHPVPSVSGRAWLVQHFYAAVGLCVALLVSYAFGRRIVSYAMGATDPRPWVVYLHIGFSTLWVMFFFSQATLIGIRRVAWHRFLGWFGFAIGGVVPVAGIATALAMARLHMAQGGPDPARSLIFPIFEMLAFALIFGLAVAWRRRPEYHRRLMLMATCVLAMAAFPHLPDWVKPMNSWFGAVALIFAGAARDWFTVRRVHPVFVYGLPTLVSWHLCASWIYRHAEPTWVAIAHALLRWS